MIDFSKAFLPSYTYALQHIHYENLEVLDNASQKTLNCTDTIRAQRIDPAHVQLDYMRAMEFPTKDVFALSVGFRVLYTIDEKDTQAIDWNNVDIPAELIRSEDDSLHMIASRISLLISQITSSFGQTPIVTPPIPLESQKSSC